MKRKNKKMKIKTKMLKSANFVNLLLLSFLLSGIYGVYAHDTGEPHEEYESKTTMEVLLPFSYLDEGNYWGAIFVVIFWFLLLKGGWELIKLIIGRAM